ncbi:hypothetical protein GH714_008014 [Hevea brasiliensis]|uniref:Uncharacterized protein n=1 Tax=Hevea brasiliensis TaxID=3981 RepID=A0A6A6L1K4_HEVBR|nr:hypothetical protein GH714_008014 [Hevea brasiliensis]
MAVAVPSKWVCIYATVLVVMFIGATATVRNHGISRIKSLPALSRFQPVFTASSASFPGKKAEAAVIPERAGDKKTRS